MRRTGYAESAAGKTIGGLGFNVWNGSFEALPGATRMFPLPGRGGRVLLVGTCDGAVLPRFSVG